MSAPVADWPPSVSHRPGTIADQYGPHTPGTKRGSRDTAMWQVDVPPMSARRASMSPTGFAVDGRAQRPHAAGVRVDDRHGDRGAWREAELRARSCEVSTPARSPMGRTCVPMRANPSSTSAPRPICRKKSALPSAPVVPEVGPLAHGRAERSHVVAGGAVDEEVGQIEEARGALPRSGQVLVRARAAWASASRATRCRPRSAAPRARWR